jgi:hypothetical protein
VCATVIVRTSEESEDASDVLSDESLDEEPEDEEELLPPHAASPIAKVAVVAIAKIRFFISFLLSYFNLRLFPSV